MLAIILERGKEGKRERKKEKKKEPDIARHYWPKAPPR